MTETNAGRSRGMMSRTANKAGHAPLKVNTMADGTILPPYQHPFDPSKQDIDVVAYALERLQTMLSWINEHRASFESLRVSDPLQAESELGNLKNATAQAIVHLQRLSELVAAGYRIDPNKRLPRGLSCDRWLCLAHWARDELSGSLPPSQGANEP